MLALCLGGSIVRWRGIQSMPIGIGAVYNMRFRYRRKWQLDQSPGRQSDALWAMWIRWRHEVSISFLRNWHKAALRQISANCGKLTPNLEGERCRPVLAQLGEPVRVLAYLHSILTCCNIILDDYGIAYIWRTFSHSYSIFPLAYYYHKNTIQIISI
jgi:hypothetical protein